MATVLPEPEEMPSIRPTPSYDPLAGLSKPFTIDPASRSYKHQYANIYFVRLVEQRPTVEEKATEKWKDVKGHPPLLPRILNLTRSQLCYIVGTIYMEMPLKPNILEDMARDHWLAAPIPRTKFFSAQDSIHLEDESGRVRLIGDVIQRERDRKGGGLVTGVIMAALGMETPSGDFEVIDICFAGMPDKLVLNPGPPNAKKKGKVENDEDIDMREDAKIELPESEKTWVAMVSGLSIGTQEAPTDLKAEMLVEWLMGEIGGPSDQLGGGRIARLIVAGNSLTLPVKGEDDKKIKRFNSTSKPLFPNHPTKTLATLFADLLSSSLPIHLIPGPSDPAGATLPQQPLPKILFGGKAKTEGLECETNPTWMEVGGRSFLTTGGQAIDDIFKYVPGNSRLGMTQRTLEWRHMAPTAPDTLWIYPFPDADPFILKYRPDVYIVGNQPEFETTIIGDEDAPTRLILLSSFAKTGVLAFVCLETLECRTLEFEAPMWVGETVAGEAEGNNNEETES
ncbi:DNA polymerase delta subunit 2 [Cryptococcus neoformans c45]|nr:DNA polymerase delta subunit 2 [Cryptococcus neoformans var. grubii c45]